MSRIRRHIAAALLLFGVAVFFMNRGTGMRE